MANSGAWQDWRPWLGERVAELAAGILFLTRLPLPGAKPGGAAIAQAAWAFPLAGIVIGLIGALVYAFAHGAGVPALPAAALTVAATMAATGCLHEDGLADTADGFGGGVTREQKLDIMRDSRIGVYGVCALAVTILLRAGALASLADTARVATALLAAHGAARAAMALMMFFLVPARADGLSFAAGRPSLETAAAAVVLGIVILLACLGLASTIVAAVVLAIVIALMAQLSRKQIGGQTGDALGALEQASEVVILLVAAR